jgi:hypothetical protein
LICLGMVREREEKSYIIGLVVLLGVIVLGGIFFGGDRGMNVDSGGIEVDSENGIFSESTSGKIEGEQIPLNKREVQVAEDGTKFIVDPAKIKGGGPPKGGIGFDRGIPALAEENIKFVSVEEADEWIEDNELVLVLEWKGKKRVYPLQIMVWHEIVNDRFPPADPQSGNLGDLLAVTYCPLCGSGIAYEASVEVNGERKETRFGTSGKLFNSNLIMYDEETETYWQQIDGVGIVGELTGQELLRVSVDTVIWRDWKENHKDSEVLSQETGINRNYGKDPYGSYYEDSFLFFGVENEDNRIHSKDVIFGIEVSGVFKAYREEDLIKDGKIEDVVNGVGIIVERMNDGRVKITRKDSGEVIVKERDFWFAWYAFHPETGLWEK